MLIKLLNVSVSGQSDLNRRCLTGFAYFDFDKIKVLKSDAREYVWLEISRGYQTMNSNTSWSKIIRDLSPLLKFVLSILI